MSVAHCHEHRDECPDRVHPADRHRAQSAIVLTNVENLKNEGLEIGMKLSVSFEGCQMRRLFLCLSRRRIYKKMCNVDSLDAAYLGALGGGGSPNFGSGCRRQFRPKAEAEKLPSRPARAADASPHNAAHSNQVPRPMELCLAIRQQLTKARDSVDETLLRALRAIHLAHSA